MQDYTEDYLLDKQVKIFQPVNGYRASTDAIMVSSLVSKIKDNDAVLDVGSGTGAISLCLASRFKRKKIQITGLELQPELVELSNFSFQQSKKFTRTKKLQTISTDFSTIMRFFQP